MKRSIAANWYSWLLIGIATILLSILTANPSLSAEPRQSGSKEEKERNVEYRYRFRPTKQFSLSGGKPPYNDAGEHGRRELTDAQLKANQKRVMDYVNDVRKRGGGLTKEDVVKIYARAEDFKVVHGIRPDLLPEEDRAIGKFRQELFDEATEHMTRQGRSDDKLGVNDFGSSATNPNAKTDIDATLFSAGGKLSGEALVAAFKDAFKAVTEKYGHALDPGQMDIVTHKHEAMIPDWRQSMSSADFAVKLRKGIESLKANPGAYFLEGAYLQQVMGRSTKPESKTFSWLSLGTDGKVQREQINAAQVPEFFYRPDVRARYAFGGAVGNWHFYNAHSDDKAGQAKNLLRSVDNGVGLLLEPGVKKGDYEKLTEGERTALVEKMYGDRFKSGGVELIKAILDTARNIRKLKDAKEHEKKLDLETVQGKLEAYRPILDYERKNSAMELSNEALLPLAIDRYERTSKKILIDNNIQTSGDRLKDWLAPRLSKSDIPAKQLHAYDENGDYKAIQVDQDMVTRLNYSAFFELKAAISVMDDAQISRIQDANPKYHNDIEILKRLNKKQKEMMAAPDHIDDPVGYREKAIQEIKQDITRLQEVLKTKGRSTAFMETGKTLWNRGNELEAWLQRATMDKLVSTVGGEKYLPVLFKLRSAVDVVSDRLETSYDPVEGKTAEGLLSARRIARLDKATSVIEVLKTYTKEGEINWEVFKTALYEFLSFAPGFGTLFALQSPKEGISTLTAVQFVPGYGQMLVVLNFVKGSIQLAGMAVFEPLKRDTILLAYQGYLDPETGGIITSGQRERVNSPRPALLQPVDPDRKLTLDERREKMYHYLHEKVLVRLKNDLEIWYSPEANPDIWKGPHRLGFKNLHEKYRDKEIEYMLKVVDQYVEDWWTGQGDFGDCDDCINFRGPDIRAELKSKLWSDYITGWNIAIQKEIQQQEARRTALMAGINEVAGMDIALNKEGEKLTDDYLLAGDVEQADALDEMPVVEPSVEIIAAPRITSEKHPDSRKKEELDISDYLNLRAKIHGSLKTNPGPWTVKWVVQPVGGGPVEFIERQKESMGKRDPFTDGGVMHVTAYAIDGNGKKFAEGSIEVNIEKIRIDLPAKEEDAKKKEQGKAEEAKKEKAEEAKKKADEGLDKLTGVSNRAQAVANEAAELCNQAKQKAAEVTSGIETLRKDAADVKKKIEALRTRLSGIKEKAKKARGHADAAAKAGQKVVELKQRVETMAVEPCRWAEAAASPEAAEGERHLAQRAQKALAEIGKMRVEADGALQKARTEAGNAEAIFNDVRSIPQEVEALKGELGGVQARLEAQRTAFSEIGQVASRVGEKVAEVKKMQAEAAGLAADTQKALQSSPQADEVKKILADMKAKVGQIASVAQKMVCLAEIKAVLGPLGPKLTGIEGDLKGSVAALDQAAVLTPAESLVRQIESAAKDARASADTAEVFFEGLQQLAADAAKCGKAAQEAAARRADALPEEVTAAIRACEFDRAKTLISQMPAGPKRNGLQQAYEASKNREDHVKVLFQQGKDLYGQGKYREALAALKKAGAETQCETRRSTIDAAIAKVESKLKEAEEIYADAKAALDACDFQRGRGLIEKLPMGQPRSELARELGKAGELEKADMAAYAKAKGLYDQCKYDDAIKALEHASSLTPCSRVREKLAEELAIVRAAQERQNQARAWFERAKELAQQGDNKAALAAFMEARERTLCQKSQATIDAAIAKIRARPSREELVARTKCQANSAARWNEATGDVRCGCVHGYEWNDTRTACVLNKAAQVARAKCPSNSAAFWDETVGAARCGCDRSQGYEWDNGVGACVNVAERQREVEWWQAECARLSAEVAKMESLYNDYETGERLMGAITLPNSNINMRRRILALDREIKQRPKDDPATRQLTEEYHALHNQYIARFNQLIAREVNLSMRGIRDYYALLARWKGWKSVEARYPSAKAERDRACEKAAASSGRSFQAN